MNPRAYIYLILASMLLFGCRQAKAPAEKNPSQVSPNKEICAPTDPWVGDSNGYRTSIYSATDSASAATAMATGCKTVAGALSLIPNDRFLENGWSSFGCIKSRKTVLGVRVLTIAEQLKEKGFAIGSVTSVPFNHATPAAFFTHARQRSSLREITRQLLEEAKPDVLIGAGHPETSGGRFLSERAWSNLLENHGGQFDDYDIVGLSRCRIGAIAENCHPAEQLEKVGRVGKKPLLAIFGGQLLCNVCKNNNYNYGFFVSSHYEWDPDMADVKYHPSTPTKNTALPNLADSTRAALTLLQRRNAGQGLFLMVEGGDIDWANHHNDFAWMNAAMHEFEEAVKEVVRFVDRPNGVDWKNTLVIVTADHANSYMRINKDSLKKHHKAGTFPKQRWKETEKDEKNGRFDDGEWFYGDNDPIAVTYGTVDHTNELVTLAARGRGANKLFGELEKSRPCGGKAVSGLIDNTQIFEAMSRAATEHGIKNIILMIGDGMHEAHEAAYSILRYGDDGLLVWQQWNLLDDEDSYTGKVTTWDISTYDYFACEANRPWFKTGSCNYVFGYDDSMTPADSVSIENTPRKSKEYFLRKPRFE